MSKIGRNQPCPCGSGKKYKKCCLGREDVIPPEAIAAGLAKLEEQRAQQRALRELGIWVNYVNPVTFRGKRVWGIGNRVYHTRPPAETFHEFIIFLLQQTLGEEWWKEQEALVSEQRHFVKKCFDKFGEWRTQNATQQNQQPGGLWAAVPSGYVQYLLSLAFDVASLIHKTGLPEHLLRRLRDPAEYQGARYEVAVAAIFARLDCEIRFLDDERLDEKHPEFVATHRPTGAEIAVEAKSRHREGVIHREGERDDYKSQKGDVQQLFNRALAKAPENRPFMIFIDLNAPPTPDLEAQDKKWFNDVKRWMATYHVPTPEDPDIYTALCITNYSQHYRGDEVTVSGENLRIVPLHVRSPLSEEFLEKLWPALDHYGSVPNFTEDTGFTT